jgi:glycosyltransferase involved in cell wall biosynthesis
MKIRNGTFCTIFPGYKDFHFYKDPGQVPYRFSKLGYTSTLVCYGRAHDFPETEKYLKITCITDSYLSRKFNSGIIFYLLCNSRKIDILNTFHLTWSSLLFVFIYKVINRKGFAYIKLDNCAFSGINAWEIDFEKQSSGHIRDVDFKRRLKSYIARRLLINKPDLWSIEDEYSKELFESKYSFFKGKLITVYNGHTSDLPGAVGVCNIADKEDIIMTAGRLGTFQKATDVMLDAFKTVAVQSKYNLHLAGPVEPSFQSYIEEYRQANPSLNSRVFFHGPLGREELQRMYCRSKLFCMSSRYEGMAIVFPEAMYYMNALVTTGNVSLKPLIDKFGIGLVVKKDNPEDLAEALLKLINGKAEREQMAHRAHEMSLAILNWDNIIKTLQAEIISRLNK